MFGNTFVNVLVAIIVVMALIAAATWLVRRFGADRLGANPRGRLPRLAVIDAAAVDNRRKLVLVRRDNVEHLLMIGGPTDIVIEPHILRGQGARPAGELAPQPREPAGWSEPETLPDHDLQDVFIPEPQDLDEGRGPDRAVRHEPQMRSPSMAPHLEDGGRRPPPMRRPGEDDGYREPTPRIDPARIDAARAQAAGRMARPVAEAPRPAPARPVRAEPAPLPADADQNLAEMAHRLESALRHPEPPRADAPRGASRPLTPPARPPVPGTPATIADDLARELAKDLAKDVSRDREAAKDLTKDLARDLSRDMPARMPMREAPRAADPAKIALDSLEQDMANLLDRAKTPPR